MFPLDRTVLLLIAGVFKRRHWQGGETAKGASALTRRSVRSRGHALSRSEPAELAATKSKTKRRPHCIVYMYESVEIPLNSWEYAPRPPSSPNLLPFGTPAHDLHFLAPVGLEDGTARRVRENLYFKKEEKKNIKKNEMLRRRRDGG